MTIISKTSIFIFFVFITFSCNTSTALVSFADRCASIALDYYSTPEIYPGVDSTLHRLIGIYDTGPCDCRVQNSIVFHFWYDRENEEGGLFMVQGSLEFQGDNPYFLAGGFTKSILSTMSFKLHGIWSEASGELCMVGTGAGYTTQGKSAELPAVLKLNNVKNSSSVTSLIGGTLESLISSENDPNYFEPISISLLSSLNYQYTFISNKSHNSYADVSEPPPNSLKIGRFCSVLTKLVLSRELNLKYSSHCISGKNCSPISVSYLPNVVYLRNIDCLESEQRLRVLVDFTPRQRNLRFFHPSTTLVGEGSWDAKTNQLQVFACRFLNATNPSRTNHVGDCSMRLSLRFPAIWTIGNTISIVGKLWSTKAATESGYFENITIENAQIDAKMFVFQGQKYEYTRMDEVSKRCPRKKSANEEHNIYPDPFSHDMRSLDIRARNSSGYIGWGYFEPFSVDNEFYNPYQHSLEDGTDNYPVDPLSAPVSYRLNHRNPYNISYLISINLERKFNSFGSYLNTIYEMGIYAEGVYDDTEGSLCMVGCRYLHSNGHQQPTNDFVDCEIVVKLHFPSKNSENYSDFIKGSIESTREKIDPLHFERLVLEPTEATGYTGEASKNIEKAALEFILVVVSNTLACVFGGLQLFHVKRHPGVLPSISIFMLFILALSYMIPLMLNFNATFIQHRTHMVFLGSSFWLEVNEVVVRVVTMVGFILQIRLLQLAMSARAEKGNWRKLWDIEKFSLFVALPAYVAGSLAALFPIDNMVVKESMNPIHPILGSLLRSCVSLPFDAFLFPQILLNIFSKSKEKALSCSFYIGTTFLRVLPHTYGLYRAQDSASHVPTSGDVILSCGSLIFAGIIYLQQKFGGRCILPQKLRELEYKRWFPYPLKKREC